MELLYTLAAVSCTAIILIYAWKALNQIWFMPRKLEKSLRQQGLVGNPYRFLLGDFGEISKMSEEAQSKPINFSDDYLPRIMPFIIETFLKYGENCFLWFGPNPGMVISNPDNIREILAKTNVFLKPHNPMDKMLGQGLATYETDKWAKHRRLINPVFQLDKVKNMVPSFYLSCSEMLSKWDEIEPSGDSFEVDVLPYLQTMTSDAISRTAFGSSYEEGRKIFELQREQVDLVMKAALSGFIPGWRFLPTKTNRRMKHICETVNSMVLEIVDKRTKAMEAGEANSNDLLNILLESNSKEIQQNGNKFGMSMQDVIEECKLFYIVGQETTSTLLVWTMILLSKHPDWQAHARDEVLQHLKSDKPDFHELNHLKIVTMILYEVLRLYPPVPMLSRSNPNETTIGNLTLPAGTLLLLPTVLLQHDTKIWGDDAKEFNPERFSEGVSKATNGHSCYFPFGGGPRICIGQNFAMLEAKIALAMILQRYSFELSASYTHAPQAVITVLPQHGAHLVLHKL